jgi:predicted nucleic acid-binding protein
LSLYLDASILVALLQEEDGSETAVQLVESADQILIVSEFARGEVASAISRLVRMKQIGFEEAGERLEAFDEWVATATQPIPTEASDIRLASHYVRRLDLGLRMPDAIHLAMVQARNFTLATLDEGMRRVARELGIAMAKAG